MRSTIALSNTLLNAITAAVDAGVAPGYIVLYAGGMTTTPDDPAPTNPRCTITFAATAFNAAAQDAANPWSIATLTNAPSGTVTQDATLKSFRVFDGDNNTLWHGTVTATGQGGDLELSTAAVTNGQTITLDNFTVRHGHV